MRKPDNRKTCAIAMLVATAFVLGVLSIRIGAGIKISFKFLPVFISSALYGPIYGGLCGALSDFLSYFLNPGSGPLMPQITFVEFLYGLSYGIFFYKAEHITKINVLKTVVCVILNTLLLSLGVMSYILMDLVGLSYTQTIAMRMLPSIINMVIQFVFIILMLKYMPSLNKIAKIK